MITILRELEKTGNSSPQRANIIKIKSNTDLEEILKRTHCLPECMVSAAVNIKLVGNDFPTSLISTSPEWCFD